MTFLSYLRHGTAAFQSGLSPYKFALFPHLLAFDAPKLDFPTWLKSGWSSLISTAISKVASVLLPRFISESWRNWAASAVVQTFASRVAYNIAFWPWFLLYRGADHYGYFNRWKTLPGRSNPNKELEAEMWDHVIHNLYRFPTVELAAWLLFYSRGEMAMETVPTLPAFLVKILIQIVSVDTIYYWFHRWEHRPENYARSVSSPLRLSPRPTHLSLVCRIHKRHHDIKITNVYGHLVDSPIETLCLFGMGIASNLIVAYTVGQDLFTSCGMTLFFITADLQWV
jgi:sterol desaturase/sphingolipid hydroxylase (fatty acid hydroxylase superfamily)